MKKQFNRMKQLANQTVGRLIERRMELVRVVSHNTHKKMVSCLQGHIGAEAEKRHKKLPLTALSQAMVEGGTQLGEDSLMGCAASTSCRWRRRFWTRSASWQRSDTLTGLVLVHYDGGTWADFLLDVCFRVELDCFCPAW
uniref:BAR domain-containing protein n=1 Tax=Xiphophorus couchianus TaxID=32473 RepID=A0A3B5L035_9TELE